MNHIIYFDGVCNLCNWSVRFVLKHDKRGVFSFASLQSDYAKSNLKMLNGRNISYDSVVYQKDENVYSQSDAALQIIKQLGGAWKLLYVFKIIPKPIRDSLYNFIARNRYKWFGRKQSCMIPRESDQSRFL